MSHPPRHPKLAPIAPVGLASGALGALAAVWAVWPVHAPSVPSAGDLLASMRAPSGDVSLAQAEAPFDPAAFHTPLWIAMAPEVAPEPPAPPPSPPPIPPLRATLLAIARDRSHAIVHDQDAGRLATLRVGDTIQGRVVNRIEPSRLTLTLEGRAQSLDLGYQFGATAPPRRAASASPGREAVP